jgi:hypothetical protein
LWIWRRRRSAALTPMPSSSAVIHVSEDGATMLRRRWHPSWEWRWHLRQRRASETLVFGAIHGCREGVSCMSAAMTPSSTALLVELDRASGCTLQTTWHRCPWRTSCVLEGCKKEKLAKDRERFNRASYHWGKLASPPWPAFLSPNQGCVFWAGMHKAVDIIHMLPKDVIDLSRLTCICILKHLYKVREIKDTYFTTESTNYE